MHWGNSSWIYFVHPFLNEVDFTTESNTAKGNLGNMSDNSWYEHTQQHFIRYITKNSAKTLMILPAIVSFVYFSMKKYRDRMYSYKDICVKNK